MCIRKATVVELKYILEHSPTVMQEATMGYRKGNIITASELMSQTLANNGYYLVFVEDRINKGWLGVCDFYNLDSEEIQGMVVELYVFPEFRQQGIATRLLEYALKSMKEKGIKHVQLNVYSGNQAKRLYEELGFHEVSTVIEKKL